MCFTFFQLYFNVRKWLWIILILVNINDTGWEVPLCLWTHMLWLVLFSYLIRCVYIHQMSKSTGNFLTLSQAIAKFSADGKSFISILLIGRPDTLHALRLLLHRAVLFSARIRNRFNPYACKDLCWSTFVIDECTCLWLFILSLTLQPHNLLICSFMWPVMEI